jgi:glycosyltransferase involved in cell wall biosynthesis
MELGGMPELNLKFYDAAVDYDQAIYFAPFLAFPRVKPRSVVVSHGIAWDYPGHPWNSISGPLHQDWLRRIFYAVSAPDFLVSVDTNTLNWIRSIWPGYEHKQAYIPNFVDTDLFTPQPNSGAKIVVLYPRRLTWIRGVHQFNELARQEWEKRCLYAITAPEAFVVEDRSTANVINAKWAGYHHRLAYIPPGIDLEQFRAVSQDLSDDKIRIICPQDLTLEQGVPEILKLCQIFADRDSRVEFKIIGQLSNFDDALYLAARVRDLPNCRFEWGPLAKLSEFYQESDLALLPSRATEGASLYCLQAMASGLPVVAGPTGGLAEFVVDGWNGRLISPYYLGDLTEALIQLIQNPEQRLRMGANARLLAEGYPLSNWKSKWRNLINRVLQIKTGVIIDGSSS